MQFEVDGVLQGSDQEKTGFDLFADRSIIAMRVNGEPRDLSAGVRDGDKIESVSIESDLGLSILRHSTAHVMAQAVQRLFDPAKLGIGPPIKDGFYFDFEVQEAFTPEDFSKIESEMAKIVKEGQRFVRRVVTESEARNLMSEEPFKLELIDLHSQQGEVGEGTAEIGGPELSVYENTTPDGEVVWRDLCRGPHLPNTRMIGKAFEITRSAAAYWRGDEKRGQLQRLYGTAWPAKEDLQAYKLRLEEAARRDHRKLGLELDLFSFPEEVGSGLPVFHPKGGVIRRVMEDYSRAKHERAGYEFVYTPHITKSNLFETSGHLAWYADGMFPPMSLDGGSDYYLKPMNCPFHILIFKSRARSYREFPLRFFEFGSVYRYEKSGVVHGLTRVRGMTQDDAHLFVTQDQMEGELTSVLNFVLDLLRDYGLDDFYLELSTREEGNPKFVGGDEIWDRATKTLEAVALKSGLSLVPDPGGAAFYGPKISVQARDAIGRTWQMSTIQLDFNLPERFGLEFDASDGSRQRPIMIHRALFGSIERFFGVLTEHYAGHFPPWLAPLQVALIPIADEHVKYLDSFADQLKGAGIRVELDTSDARMQKKIRDHTLMKVPFMVIAGGKDVEENTVSFRYRDGSQENGVGLKDAFAKIVEAVQNRIQV